MVKDDLSYKFVDKRVLVTGATGLIGTHLVRKLLEIRANVIAMGRNEEKLKQVFSSELSNERFSYVIGSITNGIEPEVGILDYIFHAASPVSGAEIHTKPVDTISVNVDGTRNCLDYLRKQKAEGRKGIGRMIVFSSATVYGTQVEEETVYEENETGQADTLFTVNSPYSESKRIIEVLAQAYCMQYHSDCVIVRIGYVYGYSNPKPNTAFYEFIEKAINEEDIIINNSGMARRDNIHVSDVVTGLLFIAEKGRSGDAYNISSNGEKNNFCAVDEMAVIIADCINSFSKDSKIRVITKQMESKRKPGIKLDNKKIKALGWEVKVCLEDGIRDTIEKYLKLE